MPAVQFGRGYATTLAAITALVVEVSARSRADVSRMQGDPGRGVVPHTPPLGSRSSPDRKKRGKKVTESLPVPAVPPMLVRVETQEEV